MKWEKALKYTRKHKRMIAVMMAGVIGFACFYSADASVIKDAKKKKNEAQQNLDNINQQINNIQSEQSKVKSQMAAYDEQLMSLLTDMELLKTDIDNKEGEIDQAKTDLAAAQEKEQQQYADMKKRIQYMYENGDDTFLDALVESEDISDLLNRVEYVSEVYSYDRELLVAYQETVQQVADLESQLEQELADMEELKQSYDQQEVPLGDSGTADVDAHLPTVSGMNQFRERTTVVHVHLQGILELVRRQVGQVQGIQLLSKGTVWHLGHHEGRGLRLELLQQIHDFAQRDLVSHRNAAVATFCFQNSLHTVKFTVLFLALQ